MENLKFFLYKKKPLVRKENVIYYGNMSEDFVAMLTIDSTQDFNGLKVANKVFLQLISTNLNSAAEDVVVKSTVKTSLYQALDIARIWIERYNKKSATAWI